MQTSKYNNTMETKNYLFRVVNHLGRVVCENRYYGANIDTICGLLIGLTFGAHTAQNSASKRLYYAVAYSFDEAGRVTGCQAVNNPPRNYYHPEQITL